MARLRDHSSGEIVTQQLQWASPMQREAFEYGPAPLCLSGGFGASKTFAACLKLLYLMDAFPGYRVVVARTVWEELKLTTLKTFFKLCPLAAYNRGRRADSEKILRLNNGSELMWMHLDDPEVVDVIKGLEINAFLFDQAEDVQEEIFDRMCSRLGRWDHAEVPQWVLDREAAAGRPWQWWSADDIPHPIPPTYALLTCNPDTELHWIFKRFHPDSPEWQSTYRKLGYRMITMRSLDNRMLTLQNRQHLMNQDATFRRRYVEGEWGIPEGQIHIVPEQSILDWSPELLSHIQNSCYLYRILDHGDTSPTCCAWAAVDHQGNHFIYREYYKPDALISQHRQAITELSKGERYLGNLADPQCFLKTSQKGATRWSVAEEYADTRALPADTALCWNPADNSEMSTRNRINEYLYVDPERLHPVTKEKGAPRLYFIRRSPAYPQGCDRILRETQSQRRVKIGTELGRPIFCDERDPKVTDHGYDVVRYFIASRPPVAPVAVTKRHSQTSFHAVHKRQIAFQRAGGFKRLALLSRRASILGGRV